MNRLFTLFFANFEYFWFEFGCGEEFLQKIWSLSKNLSHLRVDKFFVVLIFFDNSIYGDFIRRFSLLAKRDYSSQLIG